MSDAEQLPSGPQEPVWIIVPGTPGGGTVDPGWSGGVAPDAPGPQPPDGAHPSHPIVLPPELVDPDYGIDVDQEGPSHPIYIDPYPDNSLPEGGEEVGELSFYQRKTLGINWDKTALKSAAVGVYAEGKLVRTVANTGSSSVTYPQDFTGSVSLRVADSLGNYCEGTTTVK